MKSVDELPDNNAEAPGPGGPSPLPGLLEPDQYDGEPLCPRCGAGLITGRRYRGCADGLTHEESCALYETADKLCGGCERDLLDDLRRATGPEATGTAHVDGEGRSPVTRGRP